MRRFPNRLRNLVFAGAIAVVLSGAGTLLALNYTATVVADQVQACHHEYAVVQSALYAYMANHSLATLPGAGPIDDMTSPVPLYVKSPTAAHPSYVPSQRTRWAYTWDDSGRVTAISATSQGAVPAGCAGAGV